MRNQSIIVDSTSVQIIGEKRASILFRPVVAQINHAATMRMSTARNGMLLPHGFATVVVSAGARRSLICWCPGTLPATAAPVQMIGNRLDATIGIRIVTFGCSSFAIHAGYDMP